MDTDEDIAELQEIVLSNPTETEKDLTEDKFVESDEISNLDGTWIQEGYQDLETFMFADISGEYMEINWSMSDNTIHALYWAGSYTAPEKAGSYSWDSVNDKSRTDVAIFASGDDTKTILYDDGKLSFSVTVSGVTTKLYLIPATQEDIEYINS